MNNMNQYGNNLSTLYGVQDYSPFFNGRNNMNMTNRTSYLITATYSDNNIKTYEINIYENVSVIQNISITPTMNRGSDTIWL